MSRYTPRVTGLIRSTNRPHFPSPPPGCFTLPCNNTSQPCHSPLFAKEKLAPVSALHEISPLPKGLQRWDQPLPDALAMAALESHEETTRLS